MNPERNRIRTGGHKGGCNGSWWGKVFVLSLLVVVSPWTIWVSLPSLKKACKVFLLQSLPWGSGKNVRLGYDRTLDLNPSKDNSELGDLRWDAESLEMSTSPSVQWEQQKLPHWVSVQRQWLVHIQPEAVTREIRPISRPASRAPVWGGPLPSDLLGNCGIKRNHRHKHFGLSDHILGKYSYSSCEQ